MVFLNDHFLIFISLLMTIVIIVQIRSAMSIRSARNSPVPGEFILKQSMWNIFWISILFTAQIWMHWERWTILYLPALILIITAIVLASINNQSTISFENDLVLVNNKLVKMKAADITGVRISDHEVTFHTTKYINHHRLMTEDLVDKNWQEFQEAVEQYVAQFDHIEIERV